jgi:predicted alpha/beta-fold hydrolase
MLKGALMECLDANPYMAPLWLRNAHLQTIWGTFFRYRAPLALNRERWETPDGDSLNLYLPRGDSDAPLALLLHGLEGSVQSHYMLGTLEKIQALGWNVAVMEYRSCGEEGSRSKGVYHAGHTADLENVVEALLKRFHPSGFYLAGFSLGSSIILNWLAERGSDAPISAAAAVSSPFDLVESAKYMTGSHGSLYIRQFLKTLVPKALDRLEHYPGVLQAEALRSCQSLIDFDNCVTAPLHGFRDAWDYYERCSCGRRLENVRKPAMLLAAEDDPFNPGHTLPREIANESPWLAPQFTANGGHVGFVTGSSPLTARYWAEEQIARFFACHEERVAVHPTMAAGMAFPPNEASAAIAC